MLSAIQSFSLERRGADRNPWLAKMGIQYVIVICSMKINIRRLINIFLIIFTFNLYKVCNLFT
jgi:hypothetical protein